MRLIDADKIKLPQGFFEKVNNVPKFYEWLDKQPTVDAVEVVRCKDCKYCIYPAPRKWEKHDVKHPPYCDWWIDCGDGFDVEENDFCCHAERKEESNERADHQI